MTAENRALDGRPLHPIAPYLGKEVVPRSTGLLFTRKMTFQAWESIGQQLLSAVDSTTWWIADWLAYGEASFQDRYREAILRTSLKYQTLRNYAWIARQIDMSRRHDELSFGHHAEVAALDQPEQDFWLRKAEELNWSRNHLRSEIRASHRERSVALDALNTETIPQLPDIAAGNGIRDDDCNVVTVDIKLKLTSRQFARFTAAAHNQEQEFEEWAVRVLKAAAEQPPRP